MKHSKNFIDLTGKRFGRFKVLKELRSKNWQVYWLCLCDCGNYKEVVGGNLRNGTSRSCGCIRAEMLAERKTKHGLMFDENGKRNRLHSIWSGMRNRCNNKNEYGYKNYGGRGISVCEEWSDYKNFHDWALNNGYEKGLSIERIDNNGNYCPENCSWETRKVQNLNKRNIRYIDYKGERVRIHDLSTERGIDSKTVLNRLRNGWDIERALSQPVQKNNRRKSDRIENSKNK